MADTGLISISDSSNGITGSARSAGQYGVFGNSNYNYSRGLLGSAKDANYYQILGISDSGYGVVGFSSRFEEIQANSNIWNGIIASANNSFGVYGESRSSYGVFGSTTNLADKVLLAISDSGHAILGSAKASNMCGVYGSSLVKAEAKSTNYAALRLTPQSQPSVGSVGDLYVDPSDYKLRICTTAGTPGTWTVVGSQT